MKLLVCFPVAVISVFLIHVSPKHAQSTGRNSKALMRIRNERFECVSEGFHADPDDCSIFYRCVDWGESSENTLQRRFTSFKFQCGIQTVYDPETNSCIHPTESSRLECRQEPYEPSDLDQDEFGSRQNDYGVIRPSDNYNQPSSQPSYGSMPTSDSGETDNTIESSSPSIDSSPPCSEDGFFAVPGDCKQFYRCVSTGNDYLKYNFACADNTVWDPETNSCNHEWAVHRTDCKITSQNPSQLQQTSPSTSYEKPTTNAPPTSYVYPKPQSTPATKPPKTTVKVPPATTVSRPLSSTTLSSTTSTEISTTEVSTTEQNNVTTVSGDLNNTCTSPGFYGIPNDCSKFIRCVETENGHYVKYDFECAEGTVWDNVENTCNYPYAVQRSDCGNESSTTPSSQSESSTIGTTSSSSGQNTSSTQTTATTSVTSSQQTTSSNTTQSTSSTTSSQQTTSVTSQQNSSTSSTSTTSQSTTSNQQSMNQQTSNQQTTNQQTTNEQISTAAYEQNTNATQTTDSVSNATTSVGPNTTEGTSTSTITSTLSPNKQTDKCTAEGFFPSSENCNQFYRCVKNSPDSDTYTKYNFNCGPGTVWDPENNVCNYPSAVRDCKSGTSTTQAISSTEQPTSSGTIPASTTQETSNSTEQPTSSGTILASTTQETSTVNSTEQPTSSGTTLPASTISSNTTDSTGGLTTNESNPTTTDFPTSYSTTTETQSTSSSTNTTETFEPVTTDAANSTSTESVTSMSTDSEGTTITDGSSPKPTPPTKVNCTKAGFYPHPTNCKKFYRCVDWDGDKGERFSVYHFDCPEGTIFDPSLNICNHADSVYPPRDCNAESTNETTESTNGTSPNTTPVTEPVTTDFPSSLAMTTTESSTSGTDSTTESVSEMTTVQTSASTLPETTTDSSTSSSITTTLIPQTTPTTTGTEQTTSPDLTTTQFASTPTTTDLSTTSEKPTENTKPPTTQLPEESTLQTTTTATITTTDESSSTTTSSPEQCPEMEGDQFSIVCPTGFRRHPKYCNLFYQCTVSKTNEIKVLTLSCVNGTIYDEKKIQCLPPDEAKKCDGSMMDTRNLRKLSDGTNAPVMVSKVGKPICTNAGSYAYPEDCSLFYKCISNEKQTLDAFLYQCPEGYVYWNISKRCEKAGKVSCEGGKKQDSWKRSLAPVETSNIGH